MNAKIAQFINKGMRQDLSIDKVSNEYAFENVNIRITENEDNTLLSVTNELGNSILDIENPHADETPWYNEDFPSDVYRDALAIPGNLIGSCVIAENLVLFFTNVTENYPDAIIRVYKEGGSLTWKLLYCGHLNFSTEHPIETLGDYESESSIKVYWVDGHNQARFINIVADDTKLSSYTDTSFDFLPTINKFAEVNIERINNSTGLFPSGVIQYAFTYSNLNGQESAVFYTSMLQYIMFEDRAGSPDEIVNCSFKITLTNIDKSFDRINIYSIYRASYNGTPISKRVNSIDTSSAENDTLIYTDNNSTGEIIDNSELFYKGGDFVISGTLDQKDSVLFFGDLKIQRYKVKDSIQEILRNNIIIELDNSIELPDPSDTTYFPYSSKWNPSWNYLKNGETYRMGVQLQDKYGKWSDPIYLLDYNVTWDGYTNHIVMPNYSSSHIRIPRQSMSHRFGWRPSQITDPSFFDTYKRIRPVIVLPTSTDRKCIAQGVVSPTVFKLKDRYFNRPFAEASWFFRPIAPKHKYNPDTTLCVEYRHTHLLPDNLTYGSEISNQDNLASIAQTTPHLGNYYSVKRNYAIVNNGIPLNSTVVENGVYQPNQATAIGQQTISLFGADTSPYYAVDSNIITFHSPEINELTASSFKNLKFKIVGEVPIVNTYGMYYINTSSSAEMNEPSGFYDYRYSYGNPIGSFENSTHLCSYPMWIDLQKPDSSWSVEDQRVGYPLYPWHKEGPLSGHTRPDVSNEGGLLTRKILSNTLYSNYTRYIDRNNLPIPEIQPDVNITAYLYDDIANNLIQLNKYDNNSLINTNLFSSNFNYYGSVNTLNTPNYVTYPTGAQGRYYSDSVVELGLYQEIINNTQTSYKRAITPMYNLSYIGTWPYKETDYYPSTANKSFSTDPVSIKYKTTKHLVFHLNTDSNGCPYILPGTKDTTTYPSSLIESEHGIGSTSLGYPFWNKNNYPTFTDSKDYYTEWFDFTSSLEDIHDNGFLWMCELYKEIDPSSLYGGTSEFALAQNNWIPAGEPSDIYTEGLKVFDPIKIVGDTTYQRWDCLKTYAYTNEDTNSITETLSFMVESQINLSGRYDKNRGRADNTSSSPENVNLFNDVYNQENNYFNYRIFEDFYYTNTKFPNQFTWSLPKSPNSEVDNWTNITLSSVYNVDGSLGKINKIKRFRDVLFGFQDKGIFQILFNSRSQIATTTGVPIELANSGKVDGVRYLSTMEGCQNKWTICETPNGLYFIDDINHSINRFSGENLEHLSTDKGFDRYMRKENNIWQHTFYDRNLKDVYFVSQRTSLAFSEKLNEFMSFYPGYANTPLMCNLYNHFIDIDNSQDNNYYTSYENHVLNNYDVFYEDPYPYSITYRVAQEPYLDKIFTNIEYDAEMRQNGKDLAESFDTLKTNTDYQEGSLDLIKPNLIRKFRKWRANIPRDKTHVMDRMRGPWMTLTLIKKANSENRDKQMEFHNLLVKYFV